MIMDEIDNIYIVQELLIELRRLINNKNEKEIQEKYNNEINRIGSGKR